MIRKKFVEKFVIFFLARGGFGAEVDKVTRDKLGELVSENTKISAMGSE